MIRTAAILTALSATQAMAHGGHGAPADHLHWEFVLVAVPVALAGVTAWKLRG